MKCERGIDSEVIQMLSIADDYSKIALLCSDRNIELHAQYGRHFKIRIPRFGRDMIYNPHSADLLTVGEGNEIYRLNLGMGRFQAPLESECKNLNCADYSPNLELMGCGGEGGLAEFWDLRQKKKAHNLIMPEAI